MSRKISARRSCPCLLIRTTFAWKIRDRLKATRYSFYLDAFCRPEHFAEFLPDYNNLDELKIHYRRGGLGDVKVKKFLNNVIQSELAPIRERRKEWEQRLPDVYDILAEGSKRAEATAQRLWLMFAIP